MAKVLRGCLLTVQSAVRATCSDKDLTEERSSNNCHCDEVRSAMATGKASEHHVIHAKDQQFFEVSWIGLRPIHQSSERCIGKRSNLHQHQGLCSLLKLEQ